jgi:DNA-binding NarL/FixJ family response regulator
MIRILLAEQENDLREALAVFLVAQGEFTLVDEARDWSELLHMARTWPGWDVILVGLSLDKPDGIEPLRALIAARPLVPVLLLIDPGDQAPIAAYLRAGAAGCVATTTVFEDLPPAIRRVLPGSSYISASLLPLAADSQPDLEVELPYRV